MPYRPINANSVTRKSALIIGNSEYKEDDGLAKLRTPANDIEALAGVLLDPALGCFDDVAVLSNAPSYVLFRKIAEFFANRKPEELLLLYFSGHGIRDERLQLYLASPDTTRRLLDGSAVRAADIRRLMDESGSRRQILILDCCHSGAFPSGVKSSKSEEGNPGSSIGTEQIFAAEGYGRIILTASDATEYAWEGDELHGESQRSVFTEYLVKGIRTSEADLDFDQLITVEELFDYTYDQVLGSGSKQRPQRFGPKEPGRLVIAKGRQRRKPLPLEIEVALRSQNFEFRRLAVMALLQWYREDASQEASAYLELVGLGCDPVPNVRAEATTALDRLTKELRNSNIAKLRHFQTEARQAFRGQPLIEELLTSLDASELSPSTATASHRAETSTGSLTWAPRKTAGESSAGTEGWHGRVDAFDVRPIASGGGFGFVANIRGIRSHDVVVKANEMLINLTHRGASGADPETGDGAGILLQIPHGLFARRCDPLGFSLPESGEYAVGMVFLPIDSRSRLQCEEIFDRIVRAEGLFVLGWRDVPTDANAIGRISRASQPYIKQIFVGRAIGMDEDTFERALYLTRKRVEHAVASAAIEDKEFFYVCSFSSRTIVYKGLMLAPQLPNFYSDLSDPATSTALAVVHQSFSSTPSWNVAQPCRYLSHTGSFTTLRGNLNWFASRESIIESPLFGNELRELFPTIEPRVGGSACFDNVLELLIHTGRSLPHAMAMLIPEAWSGDPDMDEDKHAFYEYHASLMEPWDGPAAIIFTDGRVIGATLDRNGLRPGRYIITKGSGCPRFRGRRHLRSPRGCAQKGQAAARPHVPHRHGPDAYRLRCRD